MSIEECKARGWLVAGEQRWTQLYASERIAVLRHLRVGDRIESEPALLALSDRAPSRIDIRLVSGAEYDVTRESP